MVVAKFAVPTEGRAPGGIPLAVTQALSGSQQELDGGETVVAEDEAGESDGDTEAGKPNRRGGTRKKSVEDSEGIDASE